MGPWYRALLLPEPAPLLGTSRPGSSGPLTPKRDRAPPALVRALSLPSSRVPGHMARLAHQRARQHPTGRHVAPRADAFPAKAQLRPGEPLPADYTSQDPSSLAPPRRAGVLLHPSSLPGPHGIGDLGPDAHSFVDWLADAGCTVWQVLPLVPPGRKNGEDGYPYASQDANCGNTLLLSLELLHKEGLLEASALPPAQPVTKIDFEHVARIKDGPVAKAARALLVKGGEWAEAFEEFKADPVIASWLPTAALFAALDAEVGAQFWWHWPQELRDRDPGALAAARERHRHTMEQFMAEQFLFQRQWQSLHSYANSKGVRVVGDMPIYVGGHSADVWANRSQFMLDPSGAPAYVSGVPPDLFSATGQLWGCPLYCWPEMERDGFRWWALRLRRAFDLFDEFRIDHFRGFAGYWSIPADAPNAMTGEWLLGPGKAFFDRMKQAVDKKIDIIAEDLGVITADVVQLKREIGAAGMAVLQFAFSEGENNPHLPYNHEQNQFVYPGTHDNDTVIGWWRSTTEEQRQKVREYLQYEGAGGDAEDAEDEGVAWVFIQACLGSVACTSIVPMQDIMGLGSKARMNNPAIKAGNWGWRMGPTGVFQELQPQQERLRALVQRFGRMPRTRA